ncbi:tRNA lysidine(34) synthetase TilS [Fusobacterium polymorphum]|jgi:tRNA(Ile)-lysidine synthetase, N-terminal domain/tRNA(Ile)-lysidine synthetase, C-terminal domain|uniref:tRNA(Ile)-lysidine synthase n=2 Tax=Fusobacterium TaxID=848 RepID=A0A0S2ZR50_FUSNP|nr:MULTISPECIES: tRNA lysidine(34) synthetase TilS [Fusobacterium]ALM95101.1 tRNA(Ile)-lysidine synthetase [Fusobacterium polymorphum]ALQ41411.1 tRNA(Ile)-lysidine synthetase [Fusobacterium polymorphum]ERT46686.1 tRNA(Ile)-lysidine synthase [Fusobacterium nucleatum CTI-6]EUB37374.1 tRNA(Ile)-lysidine synthetase [Fusobacterium sp. OBRC1]PHI11581.1 tRNA lysidine(34) synthetase TilS [Fusobacterium polymorphum]
MELFREILNINKIYNLIESNDIIVVGFSGGPDSVFLVEMLKKLQHFFNFKIYLVHINHLLRGEDADSDENFSFEYAKKNNLEIFIKRIPVKEIAKEVGKTLEEVGREERYKFFSEIYEKVRATKIATAHNKDDQIETFLFRLIRGTSLQGLEGIKIKNNNVIRPISEIYKKDILEYLNKNEIQYKIDKTNFENEFTRNSIRLDLIPFIEERYNIKFKDKIFSLIKEIRENNQNNSLNLSDYTDSENRIILEKTKFLSNFDKKNLLSLFLNKKNIEVNRNKIDEISSLIKSNGTKKIDLDKSYRIVKDYTYLYIEDKKENCVINNNVIQVKIPSEQIFDNFKITVSTVENLDIPKQKNQYLLDAIYNDIIEVRYRKEGDRIFLGEKHSKKIKEIFIDQKIPKDIRDRLPIFLYNDTIFWIYNVKKAYIPKINKNESKLIKVLIAVEEVK